MPSIVSEFLFSFYFYFCTQKERREKTEMKTRLYKQRQQQQQQPVPQRYDVQLGAKKKEKKKYGELKQQQIWRLVGEVGGGSYRRTIKLHSWADVVLPAVLCFLSPMLRGSSSLYLSLSPSLFLPLLAGSIKSQ